MSQQSGGPFTNGTSSTPPAPRRPLSSGLFDIPSTPVGWVSFGLAVGFFVCFGLFQVAAAFGQTGGDTFGSNLWLAVPIMAAGASAIGGAVAASIAIVMQRERSFLVLGPLLLGLLVVTFLVLELTNPH